MKHAHVQNLDELEAMEGFGGCRYYPLRKALDVSAFGVATIEMPAGNTEYPNHGHERSGQEEVYITLGEISRSA